MSHLDGVDEEYEDYEPSRQSPQQSPQQSPADGIAGLDMNIGAIVPPNPDIPDAPRVRGGIVARFRHDSPRSQGSRSQSPDEMNLNFLEHVRGDDATADANAIARAVLTSQLMSQVAEAAPDAAQNAAQNMGQIVSSILEPQQRRQQQEQQRHQQQQQLFRHREMIIAIMRECPNVRINRLIRLIAAMERENLNESRLREHLRQLEQMLDMRRRTRSRLNDTVSHSDEFMRAFRRLGCRSSSARARRAFYALISQLRDQVVQRLDELNVRRTRRAYPQSPQPQSKGGKRQTRKKSTKRNRTVKRR